MPDTRWCLPFIVLLLFCEPLQADVRGTFSVATNYLWRGVTQTDDHPAASLALEYHHGQGAYFGVWASNTDYGDAPSHEVNAFVGQQLNFKPVSVELAIRHYYFPKGGKFRYDFARETWDTGVSDAFTELQFGLGRDGWGARYSYSNDYLASGSPGHYFELNYLHLLTNTVSLELHFGTQISDAIHDTPEQRVGDYRATMAWQGFFFTASNLTDNADGRQSDNVRYVLGWSTNFSNNMQ